VVPVILGSYKTLLSKLTGDRSAWPVYPIIENPSKTKRRSVKLNRLILIRTL
ncbi:hypothetical protein K440DRAFT_507763, partial [Wilcoxina mikolae CBS 423.85]